MDNYKDNTQMVRLSKTTVALIDRLKLQSEDGVSRDNIVAAVLAGYIEDTREEMDNGEWCGPLVKRSDVYLERQAGLDTKHGDK